MNETHKWTPCGLNADWCIQAWHYGTNDPNCVDGDYYVLDNEDGNFLVARYFPSKEEDCVTTIASFLTKAEAMAMVERKDTQELKVTEFCAGKTPEQIVEAIRELGETKKEDMSQGFIDMAKTLGVESGDNACYHTANPDWEDFIDLQGQWISFLASREIVDFIESYEGIGDEKRIEAIQEAIWEAFPSTPKA